MIGLAEMLLTASVLSGAAALCLKLLPLAPPRVRLRIALAGLAAWAVPWPLLTLPVDLPISHAPGEWLEALPADVDRNPSQTRDVPLTHRVQSVPMGYFLALLFLPGVLRFGRDVIVLRATLRRWRVTSRVDDSLRAGLAPELRDLRATIRLVEGSTVAATSGVFRPVVWLGERLSARDREVGLVHELTHVQARDPLRIALITLLRRIYWWNPAVAWLGREAVLAMEANCDRRCTRWLGAEAYTERLAAMMLEAVTPSPRLLAHARTPSLNIRRLKLLQAEPVRMRRRDYVLIVLSGSFAGLAAVCATASPPSLRDAVPLQAAAAVPDAERMTSPPRRSVVERHRPAWSRVPIPDTPAGAALAALLGAFNAGDAERLAIELGAFTPQELEFDVPRASAGLELVAIAASEPLRIEYVAEDRVGRTRRRGELEVLAWDTRRIARLEVHAVGR